MTPPSGWMDGYSDPPPREPRPRPPAPPPTAFPDQACTATAWAPGQVTVMAPTRCCPACGSIAVTQRDNGKSEQIVRWECGRCTNGFKAPRVDIVKAYGIA